MTRAMLILAALSTAACSKPLTPPALLPTPPRLPAQLRSPCPPLPTLPDAMLGTLALADANAALAYAECQAKQAALVESYDAMVAGLSGVSK